MPHELLGGHYSASPPEADPENIVPEGSVNMKDSQITRLVRECVVPPELTQLWQGTTVCPSEDNPTGVAPAGLESGLKDVHRIVEFVASGGDVNAADKLGYTALMLACRAKSSELVRILLDAPGIDIDAQNKRGFTALMFATAKGHTAVVRMLIDKGADTSLKDTQGRNVCAIAEEWNYMWLVTLYEKELSMSHKRSGVRTIPAPGSTRPPKPRV